MEPEGTLPHSQQLATCPYHEPEQFVYEFFIYAFVHFLYYVIPT